MTCCLQILEEMQVGYIWDKKCVTRVKYFGVLVYKFSHLMQLVSIMCYVHLLFFNTLRDFHEEAPEPIYISHYE